MIGFNGAHYPKDVILYAIFFYVRYTDIMHAEVRPAASSEKKRFILMYWVSNEKYMRWKFYNRWVIQTKLKPSQKNKTNRLVKLFGFMIAVNEASL